MEGIPKTGIENKQNSKSIETLNDLAKLVDYSFINTLNKDLQSTADGIDHNPRQVFSGHYVPVKPTPIKNPKYIAHSKNLFKELGFANSLVKSPDLSFLPFPNKY